MSSSRGPEIMGDAAVQILSRPAQHTAGSCFVDAELLTESGVDDLSR